ncbi:alpha/beta fold hydrolase [Pseudonocardia sp. CA-107938]|uniref:alpha/beta fold hydrolase n=1 Tax=Pseudonocardia sp. CA-107938 TaxID=3240021 RepID=UPI003D9016BB
MDLQETFRFEGRTVRWGAAGAGDPLVLVHGTPFSSQVWRRIAPHLTPYRRVYWWDLLGYGASDKAPGDVSLGVQNRVFAALLDHWGLTRPDVVAHDFGGATALRTHLLDGRDYRTLTLVDPVAIGTHGSPFVQAAREHEAVFAGLPAYIHEALLRAYVDNAAHRDLTDDELDRYAAPWRGPVGQAAFYRQVAQQDDRYTAEFAELLGDVRCPVHILWGEQDRWVPAARAAQLAAAIPGARYTLVPDAGHLLQEDAPEAVLAGVLSHIGTVDTSRVPQTVE